MIIETLVERYGVVAKQLVSLGVRPAVLPCEQVTGEHCSTRFLRIVDVNGVGSALTDLQERCPKGRVHSLKAVIWSTFVALNPLGASSEPCGGGDPCLPGDPTAADPCGGRDPLSQDIANCDC